MRPPLYSHSGYLLRLWLADDPEPSQPQYCSWRYRRPVGGDNSTPLKLIAGLRQP
ncbi:hypothetical protein [Pantoea sp. B65]|uniref:hypothetical protein n=1 Tax=Pantoea sp. B65 TaxID=2813359 RepID=UPI0039B50A86